MISDTRLKYLNEAAKLGSMRSASDALDVATSSISRQIGELEKQMGTPLIEKGRRGVVLTEVGEAAVQYYRARLAAEDAFQAEVESLRDLQSGKVRIAVGEAFVNGDFIEMINRFAQSHPGLTLEISVGNTHEVVHSVLDDEASLGLIFDLPREPNVHVWLSLPQPLKLIVLPQHRLANQKSVNLKELLTEPMCLPMSNYRIRQLLHMAESEEHVFLTPSMASNSLTLLKDYVCLGRGASIMPELVVREQLDNNELVAVPIDNPTLSATQTSLVTRVGRQLPVGARKLMHEVESWFKQSFK